MVLIEKFPWMLSSLIPVARKCKSFYRLWFISSIESVSPKLPSWFVSSRSKRKKATAIVRFDLKFFRFVSCIEIQKDRGFKGDCEYWLFLTFAFIFSCRYNVDFNNHDLTCKFYAFQIVFKKIFSSYRFSRQNLDIEMFPKNSKNNDL